MPNSSAIRRASPKNTKGKGLSHQEVMQRRHDRRKKKDKRSVQQKKKDLLREYMALNDTDENTDNKTAARKIMDLVEEINENGRMTDHSYLQIMDMLMALNSGIETQREREETRIYLGRYENYNYFDLIDNIDNYINHINDGFNRNNIINEEFIRFNNTTH